jgi:hypothetical protein
MLVTIILCCHELPKPNKALDAFNLPLFVIDDNISRVVRNGCVCQFWKIVSEIQKLSKISHV